MKVSVIIPSYNHEKFVEEAIESVLAQTFQDFEIVITDDGSSDNTVGHIKNISDPRIKLYTFEKNQGAYFALKNCLSHASGDYIAMLSSDDVFLPEKLEKQVAFLDQNEQYSAVFGFTQLIDENGNEYNNKEHFYSSVFVQENRSRYAWLKKFFYEGNFLCHPSALIRKEFYTIDQFDPRYRQLPDFDFWIKLCMKSDIYVLQENLIKFRILNSEMNTSGMTPENRARASFEYSKLLNSYLNINAQDFIKIFGDKYGDIDRIEAKLIPYYLSLEALTTNLPSHIEFAKEQLYTLLTDKTIIPLLKDQYAFSFNEYFNLIGNRSSILELETKNNQIAELKTLLQKQLKEPIDISIVTYNSKKWVDSFFESLINQTYPLNKLHIYITDNSSTDDTYEYLQSLSNKYANTFATFDLKKEKNLGFGFGHNNNFKRSCSNYILATNIDLQFEADAITNLVDFAKSDHYTTASWEMRQKPYEHPKYYNPVTLETTWSSSACTLFKKEAITGVGYYDENIFMYGEDVELSYRLRDHGYKLKYYPKSVCWHYTYSEVNQIKEVQYFGNTFANVLIRMRYGTKQEIIYGVKQYIKLFKDKDLFVNQRLKQLKQFIKLIFKAPYFLYNRKHNTNIKYKFLNWDYEFIRDGAFYEYSSNRPSHNPLVSVIIRTFDEHNGFLKEAIESIKNQTYINIELIIIDEKKDDNFQKIVESIQSDNITNIIYEPTKKIGHSNAYNLGLSKTNGMYVIFLNEHDLFFADHLEVLVQQITDNPQYSACYTSAFEVPTNIISLSPLKYEEQSFSVYHREEFSKILLHEYNYIPLQSILFKRSLYETYGGFNEELEDKENWDLWKRYSQADGFKFINKTTSLYRVLLN